MAAVFGLIWVAGTAMAQPCQWSPLGGGVNAQVYALTVFDDGGGPALYAADEFTTAGGVAANNIAKWSCN